MNIETRIANRAKSIFAAFGQTVNDFYLEAGIYFVGAFNATLVGWDIYTSLLIDGQPLLYAIVVAIVAFIAVEGLAVYLVGAAAKTGNWLLWFFSVIFALFFTYAHYQEMSGQGGTIIQYITLAIPFFVVVGYLARTLKANMEIMEAKKTIEYEEKKRRQQKLEDEERQHSQDIEAKKIQDRDEEHKRLQAIEAQKLAHRFELERLKIEGQQAQKMAKIEVHRSGHMDLKSGHMDQMDRQNEPLDPANRTRENIKMNRQIDLIDLIKSKPEIKPTELAERLKLMGHEVSISTVKRDVKALNGNVKEIT